MKFLMRCTLGLVFIVNIIAWQHGYGASPKPELPPRRTSKQGLLGVPPASFRMYESCPLPTTNSFSGFVEAAKKGNLEFIKNNMQNTSFEDISQGFLQAIESGKSNVVQYFLKYTYEHMQEDFMFTLDTGLTIAIKSMQSVIISDILPYIYDLLLLEGALQALDALKNESIEDCSEEIEKIKATIKTHMRQIMQNAETT